MILNGPKVVMDGLEFETHIMKSKRKHVRISSFTLGENILHFKKKLGLLESKSLNSIKITMPQQCYLPFLDKTFWLSPSNKILQNNLKSTITDIAMLMHQYPRQIG